ncbi:MAG: PD-(D/E)XK nuclease family protein [Elusimicrobia bacterium]|nr:PD-(D/E)XK nuclease family protein [Candidatus Obscuribacterium magneticum]
MNQLTFEGRVEPVKGEPGSGAPAASSSEPPKKDSWYKGRILSHSSVSTYRACPQRWKFRYVDKIPERPRSFFSFGKSIHAGLEFLLVKLPEPLPLLEELLAAYKANWLREGYDSPLQEKWFYQEGERILRAFYAKHQADFKNVFKIEYKFTFDIDGVPVTGFVDRIDQTASGKLALIDYKTGKAFDRSRVRTDPQLTLYQMACAQLLGMEVDTVTLYHLNSLTPVTAPAHPPELLHQVREQVVEAARGISDNKFDPKPEQSGQCQWCDYLQICPAFAGKRKSASGAGSSQESINRVADRYGQLDRKIRELTAERDQLGQTLSSHLTQIQMDQLDGEYYSVKRVTGGIEVTPKED